MRLRARVDTSQAAIVEALRGVGASVQHLHQIGHGCPDILVGLGSRVVLLELKTKKGDKLTVDEENWHARWNGPPVVVVRTPAEALAAVGVAVQNTPEDAA